MRVGVFGGSFDPVHNGHLQAAQACQAATGLDLVLFIPASSQPLKPSGPIASAHDRLAMLELAVKGKANFRVSTVEIERGGVSYTVETLRELSRERPDDRLYLILGQDALGDLPNWREPEEICRLASLLVVDRPGAPQVVIPPGAIVVRVAMPPVDVSSSVVRGRLKRGAPIDDLVPPAVDAFIAERGLYRDGDV